MQTTIVPLNNVTHKNLKIIQNNAFDHTKKKHLSVIQVHEFVAAASSFPIVFIKDSETGEFRTAVMLGLQPEENLFYSADGWDTLYVPTSIRAYPFLVTQEPMQVCIETNCTRLSEDEGERLFNEDGSESTHLQHIKNLLATFHGQTAATQAFIAYLIEKKLLVPFTLTIDSGNDNSYQLNGIYAVDNQALQALDDATYLELRAKNYMYPIFAHMNSLNLVNLLAKKKAQLNK